LSMAVSMCDWERQRALRCHDFGLKLIVLLRVFVQISAEITKPLDDRKFDGVFTINTELSPIASASFDVGR
jgi:hypothetical protein